MLRVLVLVGLVCCVQAAIVPRKDADCATQPPPAPSAEAPCPCTISQAWLDIIVAVDISASMGEYGLSNIIGTLATVFGDMTIGQGLVYQSRVALIAYAANATVIAPLTKYNSTDALEDGLGRIKKTGETEVNLLAALKAATDVAYQVPQSAVRQTVIVVAASAYTSKASDDDPKPAAEQIKEAGMKLMTIAMVRNDESPNEVESIGALSSDGYSFHSDADKPDDTSSLISDVEGSFCRANCFCPNGWFQFADSFTKPKTRFAECARFSSSPANWYGAKRSCAMQAGGRAFMASELSKQKHDFHADYVRSIRGTVVPYLIGLTHNSALGQYQWDQTYSNGTHYTLRPTDYQPWFNGTDNLGNGPAVQVQARGFGTYWFNVAKSVRPGQYMCQVNACDTDNYCDSSVGDDD